MAATQVTLVNGVSITVASTPVALYSSPSSGTGTIISAFTISNTSSGTVNYKCWVVPLGSIVGDEFVLVPSKAIKTLKSDVPYEVVSHFMPVSSVLYVQADAASAVSVRVSGVELAT